MFEKKISDEEKKRLEKEAKKAERAEKRKANGGAGSGKEKALSIAKTLVIPAIIAAILVCVIYVAIDSKATAKELKTDVVCMKVDVPKNTYVTTEEVSAYFEVLSVEMTAVSDSAYTSLSELPKEGFYIENDMGRSQMVYKDDIATEDAIMDKYKNGYEITSFAAQSFVGGVNGSLRRGDIVDVYAVDPTTDMLILMAENVYIYDVYSNTGNKISGADETATAFTVYVTPEEVEQINKAVCFGGIQIYLKTE